MEKIVKQLDKILRQEFPGSTTELEYLMPDEKVSGFLLWPGFEGKEQIDRQHQLSKVLRARLKASEREHLSAVFTLTPEEWAFYRAENVES